MRCSSFPLRHLCESFAPFCLRMESKILEQRVVCAKAYVLAEFPETLTKRVCRWIRCSDLKKENSRKAWDDIYEVSNLKYDDDSISTKASKQEANRKFADAVLQYAQPGFPILYLDAQSMSTTKTLLSKGIKNLKVPINCCSSIVNYLLEANHTNVRPFLGTVFQALQDYSCAPLSAIWFDYCCTVDGSQLCSPKVDMRFLFSSCVLAPHSVIAVTFCLRDRRQTSTHIQKRARIKAWMRRTSFQYGYNLKCIHSFCYFPSMFFLLYLCTSHQLVQSE